MPPASSDRRLGWTRGRSILWGFGPWPSLPPRPREPKRAWPDRLQWEPDRIWAWDVTHFTAAQRCAFAIVDLVSRKWIDTLVSVEETSTQVAVIFERALTTEGLVELITPERLHLDVDDPARPILLAVSDNGPQMTSHDTRAFMAAMAVAQHHGRPHTPTDQAWIESLFGHVKHEWPHLETITDPTVLEAELDRVRRHYKASGCTKASATSPPTTNTKAAATPSAKHASRASGEPTTSVSPTIAAPPPTIPRRPHELDIFQPDLRG